MEFNPIHLIASAVTLAVLIGFLCYRIGMGAAISALQPQLRSARAACTQLQEEKRQLAGLVGMERDDAELLRTRLEAALAKQKSHESQLEAIIQDADNRIAELTRRALTSMDGEILHRIAQLLDLARKTFSAMGAVDKANLARAGSRSALNLAAKAPYNLVKVEERSA